MRVECNAEDDEQWEWGILFAMRKKHPEPKEDPEEMTIKDGEELMAYDSNVKRFALGDVLIFWRV